MPLFYSASIGFGQNTADNTENRIIVVKEGQNVRDLANEYLGDPNLWLEILRKNNLQSPGDIRPDMTLKLPDQIISKANNELNMLRQTIDEASKSGAKIFVPNMIAEAVRLQSDALAKRKSGEWDACFNLAHTALKKAKESLEESLIRSNIASEAILSDKKGTVQSRKPSDDIWHDLPVSSVLVEGEKIRTLSESFAEIRFKDNKRVRLNENSQLIISKIRMNILKNEEESSVSLYKGDAYIMLDNNRQKEKFDLDVPGISTSIDSKRFRVKIDDTETQFANYDGKLKISAGDNTFILGKNQVSKIDGKNPAVVAEELLPPPALISPENGGTILIGPSEKHIRFEWEPIENTNGYWLEIAADRLFKRIVLNQKNLKNPFFELDNLQDGAYYWQAAAINQSGFPGANSRTQFFKIINDTEPPYIMIRSPGADEIVTDTLFEVVGEAEKDAVLLFNDNTPVNVQPDGVFKIKYPHVKGKNEILLQATDRAGNTAKVKRSFFFAPGADIKINYDPKLPQSVPGYFITGSSAFTLSGQTEPKTAIAVFSGFQNLQKKGELLSDCFTDENGYFQLNISDASGNHTGEDAELTLLATSLNNHITRDSFKAETDNIPPEIRFLKKIPAVSTVSNIQIFGDILDKNYPGTVLLNGNIIECPENKFKTDIELTPGENRINLTAIDKAGNLSFLEKNIILDQNPPKFLNFKLSPERASGGESLRITVSAEDESGLKAAAEFKIQTGDFIYKGFLKWNNSAKSYEGTVHLPNQAKGDIHLSYLKLSDYYGNVKEYIPPVKN